MSTQTTFRAAVGAAVVFLVLAVALALNHLNPHHGIFGLKFAALAFLIALGCAVYANYNRPGSRV